ncbi:HAD family phosphatase [Oscillospiraceae bacterium PP1C4]
MIKGAIFDLDGTLLDSMHVWDNIGEEYLAAKGVTPPPDLRFRLKTMSLLQTAKYVRGELGVTDSCEEIMGEINRMVEDKYLYEVPLKPYAAEFLQELKDAGVRICIASACDPYLGKAALQRLSILSYFSDIITCAEVGSGKDEPEIFEHALARLGTEKSQTVVFEDALHAIETAVKAGFRVVAINDPSTADESDKIQMLAEQSIHSFKECEVTKL